MKKQLTIILLLFVILFSCKKDNKSNSDKEENIIGKQVGATVIYTGEIASDGCGWLIKIDNTNFLYHPVNLSEIYKKDSLTVIIDYHLLNTKYQCSTNASFILSGIGIDAIHKR